MTITEVVARLEAIRASHGDLVVLHHDDWNDFVVDAVDVFDEPVKHVLITGEAFTLDDAGMPERHDG